MRRFPHVLHLVSMEHLGGGMMEGVSGNWLLCGVISESKSVSRFDPILALKSPDIITCPSLLNFVISKLNVSKMSRSGWVL